MLAILITDEPKWCRLMMNGDKTVEVRKGDKLYKATQKLIHEYGYAEFYVCCKKTSPWLDWSKGVAKLNNGKGCIETSKSLSHFNGKVAFKFRCDIVEKIHHAYSGRYYTNRLIPIYLKHQSCLEYDELDKYLNGHERLKGEAGTVGTAIHISDLEIFDKPKELSEFQGLCNRCAAFRVCKLNRELCDKSIKKAPQSFCYVETGEWKE